MEIIESKTFKIIISILGLVISYILTEHYLEHNFAYSGESYRKGLGHILNENIAKGSFFIFIRELLASLFFSAIFYFLIQNKIKTVFKKVLTPIWILILLVVTIYVGIEIYDIYTSNYVRNDRIIEISLTWYSRALGFFLSYLIITKYLFCNKEKYYR